VVGAGDRFLPPMTCPHFRHGFLVPQCLCKGRWILTHRFLWIQEDYKVFLIFVEYSLCISRAFYPKLFYPGAVVYKGNEKSEELCLESVLGSANLICSTWTCVPAPLNTCTLALGWGPSLSSRSSWGQGAGSCLSPEPAPALPCLSQACGLIILFLKWFPSPSCLRWLDTSPPSWDFPAHSVFRRSTAGHP